jgi:ATP-dependent Clp protease ATP-binding subunit ClpB
MTSNIGSQFIMEDLPVDERNRRVMEALRGHFRPEFLNRIDETIIFDRLTDKETTSIVDIQLKRLLKRLDQQNIRLELTDKAKKFLAKEGYDPAYGARPLKRVIQQQILNPLSVAILEGEFGEGDKIVADVDKDTWFLARNRYIDASGTPRPSRSGRAGPPDPPPASAQPRR